MKISIITPSLNQGKFIEETILSVINQEGDFDLEYIIIDGKSNDNSLEIIEKYAELITSEKNLKKCLNLEYKWISEKDSGQSEAINKGFKMATGDIINWICADDLLEKGALGKVANFFSENKKAKVVFGLSQTIDADGKEIKTLKSRKFKRTEIVKRLNSVYNIFNLPQATVFVLRDILDEIGYVDENIKYSMDYAWYLRINKKYEFYFLDEQLAKDRCHFEAKSTKFRRQQYKESINLSKKYWSENYLYYFFSYYSNLPYHTLCGTFDFFMAKIYSFSAKMKERSSGYKKAVEFVKSRFLF